MRRHYKPTDPMWVVGCITAEGAVIARVVKGSDSMMHGPSESKGKRWRWNIWGQEHHSVLKQHLHLLTLEEAGLVDEWLFKHGHMYQDPSL